MYECRFITELSCAHPTPRRRQPRTSYGICDSVERHDMPRPRQRRRVCHSVQTQPQRHGMPQP
eukprot:2212157-Rhodomonas_salina.1